MHYRWEVRLISILSLLSLYFNLLTSYQPLTVAYHRSFPAALRTHCSPTFRRNYALHCEAAEKQNSADKDFNATEAMTWDIKSAPKLDFDEDYYSVLEVDSKIAPKDLKKAYYSIVFVYHPDRKSEVVEKDLANKQMMVINGAYRVLKLPETRDAYDAARKDGYVGANAGVKGSGKNPNSKTTRPPTARYGGVTSPPRPATKKGTYAGTGRRPKFVDENGNINEDLFNEDKKSRAGWEDVYYQRRQSGSSYQGDEFARASPPIPKQEYVGTVGVNSTSPGVNKKQPTAGADNFNAKDFLAEEKAQKEKERLEQGFIFVTDEEVEEEVPNIWDEIVTKSQAEVDNFVTDAYEQLERTPVRGPLGEVTMMLRILLGSIVKKKNGDEK